MMAEAEEGVTIDIGKDDTAEEIVSYTPPPLTRGWYVATRSEEVDPKRSGSSHPIVEGEMVYLTKAHEGRVTFLRAVTGNFGTEHGWSESAFRTFYAFCPDGDSRFQALMVAKMAEFATLRDQADGMAEKMQALTPHIGIGGGLEETELVEADAVEPAVEGTSIEPSPGEEATDIATESAPGVLVPRRSGSEAKQAKKTVSLVRNEAQKFSQLMSRKADEMQGLMRLQMDVLKASQSKMEGVVKRIQELVWTINLYLGEEEQVWLLAEGEPAPAETPLTLRQQVLFMDEECAVAAEYGGIDAVSIDEFDKWLVSDPAHLAQVLPEPKGMVAIVVRRSPKQYDDPWTQAAMDEANRQTYFLLRNGANVYRMVTNFNVGSVLVPRSDEFLAFFERREYNHRTHEYETQTIRPGDRDYMKAMEQAEARKRHYMRVGLILQGLIDRTTIFTPMAARVDVTDPACYGTSIHLILDTERGIENGRERFRDWIERINSQIDKGMRIVGAFKSGLRDLEKEERKERLSQPKAALPDESGIYTLEGRSGSGFFFTYPWMQSEYEWRGSKMERVEKPRTAKCTVFPEDNFILNIDAATVDEMEYYLRSRLNRHEYIWLFPILKAAIAAKKREAAEEAPFRLLLIGEIMKAYRADHEDAESQVDTLIDWYKHKNLYHRALTKDDVLAVRTIVEEYGLRLRAEDAVSKLQSAKVQTLVARIVAANPGAILVAFKPGDREFVALVPENEENVFVTEQTWNYAGMKEEKRWKTVDSRYRRWHILHQTERFGEWRINASIWDHLTDPERRDLANKLLQNYPRVRDYRARSYEERTEERPESLLLAALYDTEDRKFILYCWNKAPQSPVTRPLSEKFEDSVDLLKLIGKWQRNAQRMAELTETDYHYYSKSPEDKIWETDYQGRPIPGRVLLWTEEANIAYAQEQARLIRANAKRRSEYGYRVSCAERFIQAQMIEHVEAQAYARFLADYGDPELWASHKKTKNLFFRAEVPKRITEILRDCLDRDVSVEGQTVESLLAEAGEDLGAYPDHVKAITLPSDGSLTPQVKDADGTA